MTDIANWLIALDVCRLISAMFACGFTLIELGDCRADLKSTKAKRVADKDMSEDASLEQERIVAKANITNDTCRLIICVVFVWLAMSSLMFPARSNWHGVMLVNRGSLIVATFAVMYKSWRDRDVRRLLNDGWERERLRMGRRRDDPQP